MKYPGLLNKAKANDVVSDVITVNSITDLPYNSKSGSIAEVTNKGVKELALDDVLPRLFYIHINNTSVGDIAYTDGDKKLSILEDLTAVYYDLNNRKRVINYNTVAILELIYREYELYDNLSWKNLNNIKLFAFIKSKIPYIYNGDKWEQMDYVQKSDFAFDNTPTEDSSNILTSGVIYNELNSKADLVNGKVPSDLLPSYVDDVIEFSSLLDFPEIGESGKIYIDISTNSCYRWSGSTYIEIQSPIELDEYPTLDSENAVLSGGVYSALLEKLDVISDLSEIRLKAETALQTETDPTVPDWAKLETKPSYTASEIGALPSTTFIPSKTSDLINDSGFITGYTETDPTVPSWAKAPTKPTYTASEVGALPNDTIIPDDLSDLNDDSTHRLVTDTEKTTWNGKQDALVSGTSIKTINSTSLLGSGDIAVQAPLTFDSTPTEASTNPVTSDGIASKFNNYVTLDTSQNVTGEKTFVGAKKIKFKKSTANDKLGFTLYDNNNKELSYLEYNTGDLCLGSYYSSSSLHVKSRAGFKMSDVSSGVNAVYRILTPYAADAKTPFNLTSTISNFYFPLGVSNGITTLVTNSTGLLDISSFFNNYYTKTDTDTLLSGKQSTLVSGTDIKTINGNTLLGNGNVYLNDAAISYDGNAVNVLEDATNVQEALDLLDTAVSDIELNLITSITTSESSASGGNNTVTITETNGTSHTFNVKNGTDGRDGQDGVDGVSLGEIALVLTTGNATDAVMSLKAVTEYGRRVTAEDLAGTSDWIKAKLTALGWELGKYIYGNVEPSNANYCITHYIPINNIVGHSLTWDIGVATNQIKVAFYTAEGVRTGYVDGATSSSTSRTITIASSGTGSATNATQLRMSLALNNLPQCYIFDNTTGEYIFRADEYISNLCKGSNLPYGVFEDNLLAQGKGDSTFKTISQKAITDAINHNVNIERGTSVQMNGGVYTKLNSYQVATLNNSDTMSMQFLIYGGDMSNGTQDWRYLYFGPVGINGNNTDYSTYFTFKCTYWGCPYLFSRASNNTSTCLGQMTGNQTPHPVVATIVLNRLTGNVRYYRGTDLIIEETSNDYKCAKFVADSGLFYFHGGDQNARFYGVQLYDCDIMRWQLHYSPYKDMLNSACQSEIPAPFINTYNKSHDFEFIVGECYNAASYNFSYNGNTITQTRKDGLAGLFYVENYQSTHVSFISRAVFTIDKSFYLYNMGNACTLLDSNGNILEERINGTGTTTYPAGTYTLIGYIDFGTLGITTKEDGATLVYTRERRFSGAVAHFNFNTLYNGDVYDNVSDQFYTFYSNNSCTTVSTNPSISQLPLRGISITNITIPHYKGEIKLDSTYGKVYIANSDYTWKQINNS